VAENYGAVLFTADTKLMGKAQDLVVDTAID